MIDLHRLISRDDHALTTIMAPTGVVQTCDSQRAQNPSVLGAWRSHRKPKSRTAERGLPTPRLALADAQRRLAENRMIMAALRRGLQEAQDRLDAISAAEAAQKQRIHGEP